MSALLGFDIILILNLNNMQKYFSSIIKFMFARRGFNPSVLLPENNKTIISICTIWLNESKKCLEIEITKLNLLLLKEDMYLLT